MNISFFILQFDPVNGNYQFVALSGNGFYATNNAAVVDAEAAIKLNPRYEYIICKTILSVTATISAVATILQAAAS